MTESSFREDAPKITVPVTLRTGPQRNLEVAQIGDLAFFEGDIALGSVMQLKPDELMRAVVVSDVSRLWPGGVVAFSVDQSLPSPERAFEALAHWRERTPIRFIERTAENETEHLD